MTSVAEFLQDYLLDLLEFFCVSCLIVGFDRGQQATWQHVNSMASSKHSTDGEHYFIGTFWGGGDPSSSSVVYVEAAE